LTNVNREESESSEPRMATSPYRGWASLGAASLFVLGTVFGFLGSALWFLLFLPAFLLSMVGMAGYHAHTSAGMRRMANTGRVMVFNGLVMLGAVFLVGIVGDFFRSRSQFLDPSVVLTFTIVHIMLGLGLLLRDLPRHSG
jgi:hypothetical protein